MEAGIPKDSPRVYRICFFVFLFFGTVQHLGNIHYGIIGFIGIVIGLVYFLIENICFTQRMLYFSSEINEFFKESIHFH